jgi:hypothetical protein
MKTARGRGESSAFRRTTSRAAAAALCALALSAAGCASQQSTVLNTDNRHAWISRQIADIVDSTDKAFGERRVEDREQIVRAKVGVRAKNKQGQETEWGVPANLRIPMPALERKANVFLDFTAAPDASNLSDPGNALGQQGSSSFSVTALKRLSEYVDLGASLSIEALDNFGPELFARYEHRWDPWMLTAEQHGFYRTQDGWGGQSGFNLDYRLPDKESYIRWANKADYYQDLHGADLKSGLLYRRLFFWEAMLSAEAGVEYNAYKGDPSVANDTNPESDDDNAYVRMRVVGKIYRPWIEYEVMPGYYYMWEHQRKEVWGIDLRLSVIYESYLSGK